jgi:hypothetical protein
VRTPVDTHLQGPVVGSGRAERTQQRRGLCTRPPADRQRDKVTMGHLSRQALGQAI